MIRRGVIELLQLEEVVKQYNGLSVVDRLNLTIHKGELVTLIGPSGCGRTTTLKMINRVIKPKRLRIDEGSEPFFRGGSMIDAWGWPFAYWLIL